jgi:hypothetical protein
MKLTSISQEISDTNPVFVLRSAGSGERKNTMPFEENGGEGGISNAEKVQWLEMIGKIILFWIII